MMVYNYDADLEVSDTCVRNSLLSRVGYFFHFILNDDLNLCNFLGHPILTYVCLLDVTFLYEYKRTIDFLYLAGYPQYDDVGPTSIRSPPRRCNWRRIDVVCSSARQRADAARRRRVYWVVTLSMLVWLSRVKPSFRILTSYGWRK